MVTDSIRNGSVSAESTNAGDMEAESIVVDSVEVISSGRDITQEIRNAGELLTRIELDLARTSEKLLNLDILVMHVATREPDFETFALDEQSALEGPAEKALEFDFLSGLLESEVGELESVLSSLQTEISSNQEVISSFELLVDENNEMKEKLQDCEESLKRSFEQLSEIKAQSANYQRILLNSAGDGKDDKEVCNSENGDGLNQNSKIKMHTAEQQRHILRMLEKSLARELDLEKKLTESRQTGEALKQRLQQEVYFMEEEAEVTWERLFEAENTAETLMGILKELVGSLQIVQFNLNGSIQREAELKSKLENLNEQLQESESNIHEKASEVEKKAESAEAECKSLRELNVELKKELNILKTSGSVTTERLELLERQLKENEIKRQHAVAATEASYEKEIMLESTIKDMENLIEDLKSKVSKAESQVESTEEKCIILSESNADLNEEINYLRSRMECLEASLQQAEEAKKETAKDITAQTKLIGDLVVQLALERERLRKKILFLMKERRVAMKHMDQTPIDPSVTMISDAKGTTDFMSFKNVSENANGTKGRKEEISGSSATRNEIKNEAKDVLTRHMKNVASTSKLETVRDIDAKQLNLTYFVMALLAFGISTIAAFLFQERQF